MKTLDIDTRYVRTEPSIQVFGKKLEKQCTKVQLTNFVREAHVCLSQKRALAVLRYTIG